MDQASISEVLKILTRSFKNFQSDLLSFWGGTEVLLFEFQIEDFQEFV